MQNAKFKIMGCPLRAGDYNFVNNYSLEGLVKSNEVVYFCGRK